MPMKKRFGNNFLCLVVMPATETTSVSSTDNPAMSLKNAGKLKLIFGNSIKIMTAREVTVKSSEAKLLIESY